MEETTGIDQKSNTRKKIFLFVSGFLLLIVLYYTVMVLIAPSVVIKEINSQFAYKADEKTPVDERIFTDSAFVKLNRDKSFYQARITMAETDSISLSLILPDSLAVLEINGVEVHRARLSYISVSKVFFKADEFAVTTMLAAPFNISSDFSTIKKEPLMLKVAPKDTSEYKPDIVPDTSKVEAVNYIMEMDNGVRLYVYQANDQKGGGLRKYFFDLNDRFRNIAANFRSVFTFKVPEYHPAVRVKMDRSDARIIYRALPRKGQVAIYR